MFNKAYLSLIMLNTVLYSEDWALFSSHRALYSEDWALMSGYRALYSEHEALYANPINELSILDANGRGN